MRVDAHQHYWRFDPVRDAWITPAMGVIRRDFLPGDATPLIAAAGIDAVVAVQADQSPAETRFLLDLAASNPFIRGVVGWIDLRADDLDEQLAAHAPARRLVGFRHIAQAEPNDWLARDDVARGVATLGRHGYAYDILVYPPQLAAAEVLVQRCEGVRFVLDHCAKPPLARGDLAAWRAGLAALARHPHVTCKLSGLVTEAAWDRWTDATIVPALDAALDAFGPSRLMFGSDWPVCLLAASYARVHDVVARWAAALGAGERAQLFGDTAVATYRLEA